MPIGATRGYTYLMADRAKIFTNGGSHSARLPKSVSVPDTEQDVLARGSSRRMIAEWTSDFREGLGSWNEEIERPTQQLLARTKDPFFVKPGCGQL
jgi:hypothetical protein